MNLRDLRYVIAVAEYQHFGKAAAACNVSQPALSMQLKKLEDELQIQLFERSNKRVLPTAVGSEIIGRARKVVEEADQIHQIARIHQNPCAGDITLGAFPTLAPYLFPLIVPQITQALPDLKLFLVEEKTHELVRKLKAGQLDAALLALPIEEEGLEIVPLFEDPFLLAVPPRHPFAGREKISMSAITGERLLLLEDGHCLRSQALEVCGAMGASERSDFRATSLETLRQMVASGLGITLIPELAVRPDDHIRTIPFEAPVPSRTIGLAWRTTSARKECLKQIAAVCKSEKPET